jgi:hypothetical protein
MSESEKKKDMIEEEKTVREKKRTYNKIIGIVAGIKTINETLSLYIKHHTKKKYLGVEIYLHAFLTLAIDHQITTLLDMYVRYGKAA